MRTEHFYKPTSLFPFSIFSPNSKITDLGVCWNSIFIFLGLFKYYSLMSQVVKSNYIFFLCIMFCFSRIELPIYFFIYLVFLLSVMNSLQILQHTWKALLKHFWHSIRQATQQSHFRDILWQDGASCDSPSFFCPVHAGSSHGLGPPSRPYCRGFLLCLFSVKSPNSWVSLTLGEPSFWIYTLIFMEHILKQLLEKRDVWSQLPKSLLFWRVIILLSHVIETLQKIISPGNFKGISPLSSSSQCRCWES